jgi:hypothetical protein
MQLRAVAEKWCPFGHTGEESGRLTMTVVLPVIPAEAGGRRNPGFSSCRLIFDLRLAQNFVAQIFAQKSPSVEVHFSPKKLGEFALHGKEIKPDRSVRLELDQHVDVAVRAEVIAKDRPEQRQFPNPVTSAKLRYLFLIYVKAVVTHYCLLHRHSRKSSTSTSLPETRQIFTCPVPTDHNNIIALSYEQIPNETRLL